MAKYRLEELCEFITDGTHQTPKYCDELEGVKFLSSKDVTECVINWDNVKYIPYDLHEELHKRLSPKRNDILLAKNGTTGVAALVDRDEIFDIYVSLALLRPKESIFPKYLFYAVNSASARRQFNAGLKGIGVPNLHLNVIRKTELTIAPRGEQESICDILDCISGIIELRKRELAQFDELIKARFIEMFANARTKLVDEICESFKIGPFGSALHKNEMSKEGYAFVLGTDNAVKNKFAIKEVRFISKEKYIELEKYTTRPRDVIMSMMGTVGRVAVVPDDFGISIISSHLCILRINEQLMLPEFFYLAFCKDDAIQFQIDGIQNGSIMKGFNLKIVKAFSIKCPDLLEQKEFLDFVKQIDKSKTTVQKSLIEAQLLFDSLMQSYFG